MRAIRFDIEPNMNDSDGYAALQKWADEYVSELTLTYTRFRNPLYGMNDIGISMNGRLENIIRDVCRSIQVRDREARLRYVTDYKNMLESRRPRFLETLLPAHVTHREAEHIVRWCEGFEDSFFFPGIISADANTTKVEDLPTSLMSRSMRVRFRDLNCADSARKRLDGYVLDYKSPCSERLYFTLLP